MRARRAWLGSCLFATGSLALFAGCASGHHGPADYGDGTPNGAAQEPAAVAMSASDAEAMRRDISDLSERATLHIRDFQRVAEDSQTMREDVQTTFTDMQALNRDENAAARCSIAETVNRDADTVRSDQRTLVSDSDAIIASYLESVEGAISRVRAKAAKMKKDESLVPGYPPQGAMSNAVAEAIAAANQNAAVARMAMSGYLGTGRMLSVEANGYAATARQACSG